MIKQVINIASIAIAAFFVSSCELPIDNGDGNDDNPNDTIQHHPLSYDGMISNFILDINQDGELDIETVPDIYYSDNIGQYQLFYFKISNGLRLLAHGQYEVTGMDSLNRSVVSYVEEGEDIKRGLEEVIYPEDYFFGPKLLAVAADINSDATIPLRFMGPIAGKSGYLALYMDMDDGRHFGWIEFECGDMGMPVNDVISNGGDKVAIDTPFKVTDAYLNPEPNVYVVAGSK